MPPIDVGSLKPFLLLGGYNAADLWPTTNLAMPGWLLLVLAPRWRHTAGLSLVGPIVSATIYMLSAISMIITDDGSGDDPDFMSLEGVASMFRDPSAVFLGWTHYVAYDALVGRWIVLDSIERGASLKVHYLLIVPCLFFALMLGPIGFILYIFIVRTLLDSKSGNTNSDTKEKSG
mmetsp:Transcript_13260/g.37831  ORF Transcript_13260/g.37831 Transcript_13260/m.37831 type:complete len:176 (+) Transcript_13260:246-773(+)